MKQKDFLHYFHQLVRIKREDDLAGHLKSIFNFGNYDYNGNIDGNKFWLWRYTRWNGMFYPVFYGEINLSNPEEYIKMKTRLNPVARWIGLLLVCLIVYVIFPHHPDDFAIWIQQIRLRGFVIFTVYFLIVFLLFLQICRYISKRELIELKKILDAYILSEGESK